MGGFWTSKSFDTRELNECDEWADSTDSRKERVEVVVAGIDNGIGLEPESVNCCDPCPRTATNRHPRAPFGFEGSTGKFGHPITPSSTCASMMSARQTAYCPPLKNPFVPSIGSRVHIPEPSVSALSFNHEVKVQLTPTPPSTIASPINGIQ
jgi:hypothetical protein